MMEAREYIEPVMLGCLRKKTIMKRIEDRGPQIDRVQHFTNTRQGQEETAPKGVNFVGTNIQLRSCS